MRWQNQRESNNVEDRRSLGGRMSLRGLPVGGKVGALLLIGVLVAGYFGYDLSPLLNIMGVGDPAQISGIQQPRTGEEDELARFTGVMLGTTERTWSEIFNRAGRKYAPTTLVLYSGATDTACGYGESATGPFYCPADNKVYIDLSFYHDMRNKLGGGGDFALGYVLAHEIGHHVQNQLGLSERARRKMQGASKAERNHISVQQELQADCLAGVWGHQVARQGMLEKGDLEEALNTANAIGDDRLQRQSMGRVVPDSFTHGTSQERMYWFKRGFDSGDVSQCDTGL